ncbi:uncharacterized protein LOC134540812 isoform X2 [Bacillus rossius redtenbacheri]|uniref:uncharacterized protein LOC134540812 isoform X2 n=1 Tax=Bacillus rossius redtenbacheri TaxID=93214 RepID=UPI002FDEE40F
MADLSQSLLCGRSKPPPARSPCHQSGRSGSAAAPPAPAMHAVQGKDRSSPSDKPCPAPTASAQVATSKEVSECLSSWLTYLQMLNGLCGAGSRLAHCLGALVQDTASPCHAVAAQCQAAWEELVRATAAASSAVRAQVLSSLQEVAAPAEGDPDARRTLEHNQMVCDSLMTFISLQQQFCGACCEYLGAGAGDPDCAAGPPRQCLPRPPLPPLGPQRRWSEAAAAEARAEPEDCAARRWSMPWESSRLAEHRGRLNPSAKLAVPAAGPRDRNRSATPDSVWHSSLASQEQLQEVIHFLSCRPGRTNSTQLYHPSQHLPGVTLTSCPYDGPSPDWSDGPGSDDRSPACGVVRRGSGSPHTQRSSWHASEGHPHGWSDSEGSGHPGERGADAILASRKSSSSTDSSSSHSLHSRSTTGSEGGAEVRAHLYSMWSGNDLTFTKLAESSEPGEAPPPAGDDSAPHTFYGSSKRVRGGSLPRASVGRRCPDCCVCLWLSRQYSLSNKGIFL